MGIPGFFIWASSLPGVNFLQNLRALFIIVLLIIFIVSRAIQVGTSCYRLYFLFFHLPFVVVPFVSVFSFPLLLLFLFISLLVDGSEVLAYASAGGLVTNLP